MDRTYAKKTKKFHEVDRAHEKKVFGFSGETRACGIDLLRFLRRGSGVTTGSRDVRALTLWQGWNDVY